MNWQIRDRTLELNRPLVMGILNVTPDSFSDGGQFVALDDAIRQGERIAFEGADIIDIGGESTRPGSKHITAEDEIARVVPIIEQIKLRFEIPISVDTTKSTVARTAVNAGADIINDISGLRFDEEVADVAAGTGAGLILMHSRGTFETMHSQPPLANIFSDVAADLHRAIETSRSHGVRGERVVLDPGIGFGKTQAQNLELIAKLGKLKAEFNAFPLLVGASRKSFLGRLLDGAKADNRLAGSIAAAAIAAWNGADILRVHDVKKTVEALKVVRAIRDQL